MSTTDLIDNSFEHAYKQLICESQKAYSPMEIQMPNYK